MTLDKKLALMKRTCKTMKELEKYIIGYLKEYPCFNSKVGVDLNDYGRGYVMVELENKGVALRFETLLGAGSDKYTMTDFKITSVKGNEFVTSDNDANRSSVEVNFSGGYERQILFVGLSLMGGVMAIWEASQ